MSREAFCYMEKTMNRIFSCLVAAIFLAPNAASAQSKEPLDHSSYDIWKTIEDQEISDDGRWVLYSLVPQEGDAELRVRSASGEVGYSIARGTSASFTHDGKFVITLIKPEHSLVRAAERQQQDPEDQPKDSLGILDLSSGDVMRIARVKSFKLPEEGAGWLAYLLERAAGEPETVEGSIHEGEEETRQEEAEGKKKKDNQIGTILLVRDLSNGEERRYEHATEYMFSNDGDRLVYAASSEDGSADGVFSVAVDNGEAVEVLTGEGIYRSLALDDVGEQVAFLSNRDDYQSDQPEFRLYHWRDGHLGARVIAAEGSAGIPDGWWVSERGEVSFSENGERVFFGTAPRPEPEVRDSTPEDETVKVDIWHWKDPQLQPMQLLQVDRERNRSYLAVVHLYDDRVIQLATTEVPNVSAGAHGDANRALGTSDLPYRMLSSWVFPAYNDIYVVDVNSGTQSQHLGKLQGTASLSPGGKYLYWWDRGDLAWYVKALDSGQAVNVSGEVPYPLHNEDHDSPYAPYSYGSAGWTEGDREFLVYDRYDVWALDPDAGGSPRNVTEGAGRRDSLRFRYVRLDREQLSIPSDEPLLLSAFNVWTKEAGFYSDRVSGNREPRQLLFMPRRFSNPTKAKNAEVFLFTRQNVEEFPNLWVSDPEFGRMRQVSDANPQQAEYMWATVELMQWRSTDGKILQGLLYKPEDFDPSKQYPLMVYFYERESNNLYTHYPPIPHRSVIRPTFYASRGYLVFIPDIVYQIGYPGESAMKCVMPGVLELVKTGYVDEGNIGVQGHSWGGYQIAYMVTKTNLFKAAAGGAPVSNMISAYGGIRWGSGMSRMFQYEKTQSRLGASLWEAPMRYIENSPIFWADKVETPLLMLHNDQDAAVPWYQGIEMFVALRRLGKAAWLVNYNGEPHWPTTYANKRDWNIRLQQYFDHFLKGAPAPLWLAEGVPAIQKGKTLGLELVGEATVATGGGR
jgi:dipeptidyl aminopeptidase/acylaminoacyl peptidase